MSGETVVGLYNHIQIILKDGPRGPFLSYKDKEYGLADWAKQELIEKKLNLQKCIKIIDYKENNFHKIIEKRKQEKLKFFDD